MYFHNTNKGSATLPAFAARGPGGIDPNSDGCVQDGWWKVLLCDEGPDDQSAAARSMAG